MSTYEIKIPGTKGQVRTEVRAKLQKLGVEYTENKSIFRSDFIVPAATLGQYNRLMAWMALKAN